MTQVQCPVCGATSDGGYHVADDTMFICPRCGGYRLAGTAIELLKNGKLKKPDPAWFRDLVRRRRGKSDDYPVITHYDLDT